MQGSSAPPPCSMPTRVPVPLRSLEWTSGLPHSPPHSLCHPAPLSALQSERPPWTRCGAPWPTSNQHPAVPTNFILLFLASRCSSTPSPQSRGHLQTAAACCRGQAAAAASSQAWPGTGHSWLRLGRPAPSRCPRVASPLESRSPATSSSRCSAPFL